MVAGFCPAMSTLCPPWPNKVTGARSASTRHASCVRFVSPAFPLLSPSNRCKHLCFPAFKPLPKVFLKPVGYLSFSSAADLGHDVPWGLGREAPLVREPEGCAPRCRVGQGCGG